MLLPEELHSESFVVRNTRSSEHLAESCEMNDKIIHFLAIKPPGGKNFLSMMKCAGFRADGPVSLLSSLVQLAPIVCY